MSDGSRTRPESTSAAHSVSNKKKAKKNECTVMSLNSPGPADSLAQAVAQSVTIGNCNINNREQSKGHTVWCSEIDSLVSLDAPELHASSDFREPISLHQTVYCRGSIVWGPALQVVNAVLSERKVAGLIPRIGDFHNVRPCKKAVFACLVTDV